MVMNYQLIADVGSTKAAWTLICPDGSLLPYSDTGINALMAPSAELDAAFGRLKAWLTAGCRIDAVHYYGAGCATPELCDKVTAQLQAAFPDACIEVASDLLGAARAMLGTDRGIVCILGTGSNSCLYDGRNISHNIPSLGFILGDEGSGAALGKRLVSDTFKQQLPESVQQRFLQTFSLTTADVLDKVYRQPNPNRFLASLVPFIAENLWNPYIYSLVRREFEAFLQRNVLQYPEAHSLPVAFVGSIACHFRDVLDKVCADANIRIGSVAKDPMQGLIDFHNAQNEP